MVQNQQRNGRGNGEPETGAGMNNGLRTITDMGLDRMCHSVCQRGRGKTGTSSSNQHPDGQQHGVWCDADQQCPHRRGAEDS